MRRIRTQYANGRKSMRQIAAKYGVTYQNIYAIVTYRSWRHL